jgi:hypothetical protein
MIVKVVKPYKKEKKLPKERRKYSYMPPDSVVVVASPANVKAPNIVMNAGNDPCR